MSSSQKSESGADSGGSGSGAASGGNGSGFGTGISGLGLSGSRPSGSGTAAGSAGPGTDSSEDAGRSGDDGAGDAGLQPPDWLTSSGSSGFGFTSGPAMGSLSGDSSTANASDSVGYGASGSSSGGVSRGTSGGGYAGTGLGGAANSASGSSGSSGTPPPSSPSSESGAGEPGTGPQPTGQQPSAYPPPAAQAPAATPGQAAPAQNVDRTGRADSDAPRQRRRSSREVAEEREDTLFEGLIDTQKPIPQSGFQGLLYRLTRINLGPSKRDVQEAELRARLNRQLRRTRGYCGYIGIASEKGGVGKTTLAALLAAEISEGRRESVGVADLNPDLGTLPDRYGLRAHHSIRDLLAHVDEIPWRYHVHDFMEKVPEMNVRVLAASTDRKIRHQLSRSDVELLSELFAPFFSFAILDNGTHITHEAMLGTLKVCHGLVLVTDNTRDGANLARKTLQFLTANGFPDIRRRVILAVIAKETASPVKVRAIERAFKDHVRELVIVPYDPSLDGGGPIAFRDPNAMNKLLRPQTRAAVRRLAAFVIDDLVT